MTEIKKRRIKTVVKYTWPIYLVSAIVLALLLSFIFGAVHRTPAYKTLTVFVSGEVKDSDKLKNDLLNKYQDKELKSVSTISAPISDANYYTKLTVAGYSSADVLIIPASKLEALNASSFGLDLTEEVITSYYQGYTIYKQNEMGYGIKINVDAIKDYFVLPEEECYMVLNGASENIGEYALKNKDKAHNNALKLVQEWGM